MAKKTETPPLAVESEQPAQKVDSHQVMARMLEKLTHARDTNDCHAYLLNHDVPNYDLCLDAAGNLLGVGIDLAGSFTGTAYIPKLQTLLTIPREGRPWLEPGSEISGAALMIGHREWRKAAKNPRDESGGIYVTKDYATGAAVRQLTGRPVAVAFTAANLRTIGQILREKFPKAEIIFYLDSGGRSRVSSLLEKAWAAVQAMNGQVIADDPQTRRTGKKVTRPSLLFLDGTPSRLTGKKTGKNALNINLEDLDGLDLSSFQMNFDQRAEVTG
jgi:phage/plasmid primase-like uncharacterized protein